jgi:hypothetical protein
VFIILYIFMDMVKDGDKKFMCILLLIACKVRCMLPPTKKSQLLNNQTK